VQLSRGLSSIFLLLQIIVLINFVYAIHTKLLGYADNDEVYQKVWLGIYVGASVLAFITSIVGLALLYNYFAVPGCPLEQFFVSWTLLLGLLGIGLSISSRVNMGLLTPCLVFLYATYALWDALISNPDESCNPTASDNDSNNEVAIVVVSLIISSASLTWTSWRTGEALLIIDQEKVDDKEEILPEEGNSNNQMTMDENMRNIVEGNEESGKSTKPSSLDIERGTCRPISSFSLTSV